VNLPRSRAALGHADVAAARRAVERAREDLLAHPLAEGAWTPSRVRTFMAHHVVCVLDFMSLVKRLQRDLTSTGHPWTPPADPACARFINEIVLDEESDAAFGPEPLSHYEWYLRAMAEVGADPGPIRAVEARLVAGVAPATALAASALPEAAVTFGAATFAVAEAPLHVVAGVFLHGREAIIPRLFQPIVDGLDAAGTEAPLLRRYLERHIEVDGGDHGPLAARLFARACRGRAELEVEALREAHAALGRRRALWDAVVAAR